MSSASSSTSPENTSLDTWRPHVEAHKFQGPTIKLLEVEPNLFAVLDHEYNLVAVVPTAQLPFICNTAFQHPPQRERPKPKVYDYPEQFSIGAGETVKVRFPTINTEDLDL